MRPEYQCLNCGTLYAEYISCPCGGRMKRVGVKPVKAEMVDLNALLRSFGAEGFIGAESTERTERMVKEMYLNLRDLEPRKRRVKKTVVKKVTRLEKARAFTAQRDAEKKAKEELMVRIELPINVRRPRLT